MLNRKEEFSLKNYNTFGIDVTAKTVFFLTSLDQLSLIKNLSTCLLIGGGSNVLFTQNIETTVIINQTKGIKVLKEDDEKIQLQVASGENWHELVIYCVDKNYGGIENMSLIPGSVGAAPMQNIGAYGSEIKNVIDYVKAINLETLKEKIFTNADCQFSYRESIFKKGAKGKYFISSITITLSKKNYVPSISYGAIKDVLKRHHHFPPSIKDVSDAIIQIRQSKLPDPKVLGNSGSFFKNPVIEKNQLNELKSRFPEIKSYRIDDNLVKVPAGWLIEQLGWKGKRIGNTGSHKDQALVLVNYGNVNGGEVKQLSEDIKESVWNTFQIDLETEVNII